MQFRRVTALKNFSHGHCEVNPSSPPFDISEVDFQYYLSRKMVVEVLRSKNTEERTDEEKSKSKTTNKDQYERRDLRAR